MAQQTSYTGMNGQSVYSTPNYNNQYSNWAAQNPYQYSPQSPQQYIQPQNNPQYQSPQQYIQSQQVESQRIWVQGESSAKAYIVKNNTEQVLWDAEQPVIYIKTVDITGKPSTVTLDYTIRNPKPDDPNETDALKAEISELKDMVKQLMSQKTTYKPNYKKGGEE